MLNDRELSSRKSYVESQGPVRQHPDFESNKHQIMLYLDRIGSDADWHTYTSEGMLIRFAIECKGNYVQVTYSGKRGRFGVPISFNQSFEDFSKEFNSNVKALHRMRQKDYEHYKVSHKMVSVKKSDWDLFGI